MADLELKRYIRDEFKNDRSWLYAQRKVRAKKTRVGLLDLALFVIAQRSSDRACCPCC